MAEYKEYYLRQWFKSDLRVGNVTLSHIDVKIATWLYDDKGFTLWEVKEAGFRDLDLKQIACAIRHGIYDQERVSYHDRPGMSWHPEWYVLDTYRVGERRFTLKDVSVHDPCN